MNNNTKTKGFSVASAILVFLALAFQLSAQVQHVSLTFYVRGVYESKISILALSDSRTFKPIFEINAKGKSDAVKLTVSKEKLPGEFVLRFDYKETESGTPYPSEKYIFINDQDLELWVNPKYCNNADSTWFQKGEIENATFVRFSNENGKQKEKLGVLQNFLMNYEDTESAFYLQGIKEYEQRRQNYNRWLTARKQKDSMLFVSTLYPFQYVPQIAWTGSETDRIKGVINHYFDGMDFKDPLIIKTSELNKWMDGYVNLYGQLSTTVALRDSLFPAAGKNAIEKAKQGNPLVYGWMVDYFFRGYETNGITAGMKVLEPYLNDTTCLTTKRQEIARRLKGMETLVAGTKAPNIVMNDIDNKPFDLYNLQPANKYILVLFWSAGCSHCVETVNSLYPWYQQTAIQQKVKIVAISLDETETDIQSYKQKTPQLNGWTHLHAPEGVRSKVASEYFVLATPVMILLDTKTKEIVALPNTVDELMTAIK